MQLLLSKCVPWLDRWRHFILALFAAAIVAGLIFSTGLDLDLSLESRFIRDDPNLSAYRDFGRNFGGEPLLVAVWDAAGDIWNPQNLGRMRELSEKIEKLDGVESVISIATMLDLNDSNSKGGDIETLKRLPLVKKLLVDSESGRGVLLIMPTAEAKAPSAGVLLVNDVERIIGDHGFVTGPLAMQSKAIEYSRRDFVRTLSIVTIAVVVLFWFFYRNVRAILAAVLVMVFALAASCGLLALFRVTLSQFALIALPILAVSGLEDVIFLLASYNAARESGADRVEACGRMYTSSGVPCFWTTVTTMAGFASLLISDIEQIRSIGLVLVVGGPLALAASMFIVPTFLLVFPMNARPPRARAADWINSFVSFVSKNPRRLAAGFAAASILAGSGVYFARVKFDFPNIFRRHIPLQEQLKVADEDLSGGASFEIVLEAKDGSDFSDMDKINLLGGLQLALSLTGPVATTISPIDIGLAAYIYRKGIPDNPRALIKRAKELVTGLVSLSSSPLAGWLSPDMKKARVHVRVRTDRERQYEALMAALASLRDGYTRRGISMTWSGFSLLYKEMERRMLNALVRCFVGSFASVLVMLMILLRSVKWGLFAMVPNILPIGMIIGIIGWTGIGFSLGLIILPAIGIGLIVDNTIHFIWGVRRRLRMGLEMEEAVGDVLSTTGCAMALGSIVLAAGFASLAVSPFISNLELAVFMPVLIFLALIFDLVGVPVLLFLRKPAGRQVLTLKNGTKYDFQQSAKKKKNIVDTGRGFL